MTGAEKLEALRGQMTAQGLAAMVVPSADPHQSEYVADHWQARAWLTGFTGSAGTAVVTCDRALLWTDFRYWIQAKAQMDGFELIRQGEKDVPAFDQWLADSLARGDKIAMDGRMVSVSAIKKYRSRFESAGLYLETGLDLISPLWENRPPMPASKAYVLDPKYAGQTRPEKLAAIRATLEASTVHVMATLDDIAWTFNLRGADVHTNPVNLAYALISSDQARLFMDPAKLNPEVRQALETDGVSLAPYGAVDEALAGIPSGTRVCLDPDRISCHLYNAVNPGARIIDTPNPSLALKAVKNPTEIQWIQKTLVKDGRAVVNFLHWLETFEGPVTEMSAAEKIREFRSAQDGFVDDSFDAIMAAEDHSAMCHYKADPQSDRRITRGMFLTDSGGNYLTGTTDITRTVHLGTAADQDKLDQDILDQDKVDQDIADQDIIDYTLVLKGHIAVAMSRFPSGTRGYQIDTLARQFLWQKGMDFGHGTGHGVGFFLCVHEGPARLSPHPVDQALKPGMVLTNEPGVYREGRYGIRLENMILVAEDRETEFGSFLKFKTLTLCHFERDLIDRDGLTQDEKNWLDAYHREVYTVLAPGLDPDVRAWLGDKTRPL